MRVVNAAKQIKPKDFLAPFIFLIMLGPSFVFRLINKIKHRELWLIAEQGEARDNGYHFYKYVRKKHPKDFCFYAVKMDSAGYEKVAKLGNVIKYGGLKHWLYYMSANLNISSQKSGNPCPIFWYFVHVTLGLYRNRVFLQHGVIHNDSKWVYYDKAKFKYFICSTKSEYDFILNKFGYKKEQLLLTGLPRWDNLKILNNKSTNRTILIMPTWREWLGGEKNGIFKIKEIENTKYFNHWNGFLNNDKFINYIEKNNIKVYFYPHINMGMFTGNFKSKSKNVTIVPFTKNIQDYLNKCDLMITDYSSVAFDFAYLGRPVIYYQFDYDDFRMKQHGEGYFNYNKDGFGPVLKNETELVEQAIGFFEKGFGKCVYENIERTFKDRCCNCSDKLYNKLINNKIAKKEASSILYASYAITNGGVEKYIMNLIEHSDPDLKNIIVYQYGENCLKTELDALGVDVVKLPKNIIKKVCFLKNIIKNNNVGVVYACNYYGSAFVVLSAWLFGVKIRITHSHGIGIKDKMNKIKVFLAKLTISIFSTHCLACGELAGKSLFVARKFEVIENGIDVEEYRFDRKAREKIRSKIGVDEDSVLLGTVGRLDDNKNQEFMIRVLKELLLQKERYKLLIVGSGRNENKLKSIVAKEGLGNSVFFINGAKNASEYYSAFDIFLLTSFNEGFPYVLLEAQANGLPIIVSSTISREVKINQNFQFVDLEINKWVSVIITGREKRITPSKEIMKYSIDTAPRKISVLCRRGFA